MFYVESLAHGMGVCILWTKYLQGTHAVYSRHVQGVFTRHTQQTGLEYKFSDDWFLMLIGLENLWKINSFQGEGLLVTASCETTTLVHESVLL